MTAAMSAPDQAPADAPTASVPSTAPATTPATAPATRARRRRWIWPVAVATLVVLVALITALLAPTADRGALDPRSAAPNGSRAVAEILRDQGVRVDVAERSDAAVAGLRRGDTLVVVRTGLLGPSQLDRLRATTADLVLVEPDLTVLRALLPGVTPAGPSSDGGPVRPGCSDPDAVAAGSIVGGGVRYASDGGSGTTACYRAPGDAGAALVRAAADSRRVTVLGQARVLQNEYLPREGDAALALRLLGAGPTLRWYLPDPLELGVDEAPALSDLLPTWVVWVAWLLLIAALVALVWRARRLGRVVTEPLPVVVRSAETVEGRARLYRVSRSRGRAAAILRTAALRRLAARLGVPPDAAPQDVVRVAAAATGRPENELAALLLGEAPRDDAHLVALAGALDGVEAAVGSAAGGRAGYGGPRVDEGEGTHR
jgi:hypothetical protein